MDICRLLKCETLFSLCILWQKIVVLVVTSAVCCIVTETLTGFVVSVSCKLLQLVFQ